MKKQYLLSSLKSIIILISLVNNLLSTIFLNAAGMFEDDNVKINKKSWNSTSLQIKTTLTCKNWTIVQFFLSFKNITLIKNNKDRRI